jgi:hypothetical protein
MLGEGDVGEYLAAQSRTAEELAQRAFLSPPAARSVLDR